MSVLSVICLASLRKAAQNDQSGFDSGEDKKAYIECGSENPDNGSNNSCQS
jgi:hypothetical protein